MRGFATSNLRSERLANVALLSTLNSRLSTILFHMTPLLARSFTATQAGTSRPMHALLLSGSSPQFFCSDLHPFVWPRVCKFSIVDLTAQFRIAACAECDPL